MTDSEFERRVIVWAGAQPDIEAVVQIGSRVQPEAVVDRWSDWDYQLIVRNPDRYCNRRWPQEVAPCWSAHFERTERGVIKLSAVFAEGFEADFVLLAAWQIKLVCLIMKYPGLEAWFPAALSRGVRNLQLIAGPGYRVVLGGADWEKRYSAVSKPWKGKGFSAEVFEYHTAAFWRHAVWVAKKILRGELRAAIRWSQAELRDHTLALLAEEAQLEGRSPRPEARQAESWLSNVRLAQTSATIAPDRRLLANALLEEIALFDDLSHSIANRKGFPLEDRQALSAWLRAELANLATSSLSSSPAGTRG